MLLSLSIQTPEVPVQVPIALLSGNLDEKIEKAARLGFSGVELLTTDPAGLDTVALKSLLLKHSLRVSAIASGGMAFAAKLTLLNPDHVIAALARQRLNEMIELASRLDAQIVTVGSFRGRSLGDKNTSLKELADVLRCAGDLAARLGVRIALEPLNRYEADLLNTSAQTLAYLEEVNHPAVGILLDSYHVNIEEASWTEPYQKVLKAGKLFYAHLGDNNRLPPGKGLIDFRSILLVLKESGYAGWLSAELLPFPDPDTAARETVESMSQWLGEIS